MKKTLKKRKKCELGKNWWKYLLSILIIIVYLLPIYVVIISSLKPKTDLSSRLQLPNSLYLENYVQVIEKSGILTAYKNTAIITVGTIFLIVVLGGLVAYPMSRCRDKLSKVVKKFVLAVMMIPGICIVVGVYSTLISIHADNTYWGIILVLTAFMLPWAIFMYSNFMNGIPIALDEAAMVDGANSVQTFFHIIIPQLKPVTVSVVLIQGIAVWNEYEYSLYLLQKPAMYNITLVVKQYFGSMSSDLNAAAACAVVAILPVIILYIFFQRYFMESAVNSAIKG